MFAYEIGPEIGHMTSKALTSKRMSTVGPTFLAPYQIVKTFPATGVVEACVMEDMVFKAIVRIDQKNLTHEAVTVSIWTNLRHFSNEGKYWHNINLPYRGAKDDEHHVYGQVVVLVEDDVFEFIFKARTSCEMIGNFFPSEDEFSKLIVSPPRNLVFYARVLRVPYMSQIIGPLWAGNEWAGMQCVVNGFSHVMCAAEELPDPVEDFDGRCYCRVNMVAGTKNQLDVESYKRAVIWIKRSMRDGYKVLIYSRHGFGRAGSILVGFVMLENPSISYEDAVKFTFERRPVLAHRNLKDTCELILRRSRLTSSRRNT